METISNLHENTIESIQDLIKINIDSYKGFGAAAEKIQDESIASLFRTCSKEREANVAELKQAVRINAEEPEDDGTLKGTAHRWWMNIRGTVTSGDEHTVLADAERGEDAIKARYEDVLKETAGSPLNAVLHEQLSKVKARHDQIRDMRDARA